MPLPEHYIGTSLIQLMRPHRYRIDAALGELGLHVGQEAVLFMLWEQDGVTQTEIAQRLDVSAPTVTKMLRGMAISGVVRREADPEDARVSRVYLTDRGQALREPVCAIWHEVEAEMTRGISEAEQLLLRRLLAQMRDNLGGGRC
jgi:MarR family transcriptional regulator, organic hydroperoxide resistance regulator